MSDFGQEWARTLTLGALFSGVRHLSSGRPKLRLVYYIVVLAYVSQQLFPLDLCLLPFIHVVVWCLLLQPTQKLLIFQSYLDEFPPSNISVKTSLLVVMWQLWVVVVCTPRLYSWETPSFINSRIVMSPVHDCRFRKLIDILMGLECSWEEILPVLLRSGCYLGIACACIVTVGLISLLGGT